MNAKARKVFAKVIFGILGISVANAQTPTPATPPPAYPANLKMNYVREWIPSSPITDEAITPTRPVEEVKTSTSFLDGLGRPLQIVNMQASPSKKDIVSATVYDEFGRNAYNYLPFTSTNTPGGTEYTDNGGFKLNPFQQQQTFMNAQYGGQGETFYYGQTDYEASPLNRIQKSFAAGNSWVGSKGTANEKSIQSNYLFNTVNDDVKILSAGFNLWIAINNTMSGTTTAEFSWTGALPSNVVSVFYLYRLKGSTGSWTTITVNGGVNPYMATLTLGTYEYALQFIFSDGSSTMEYADNKSANVSMLGNYGTGQLYKNVRVDEKGMKVIEFKDKDGKIILKKVQKDKVANDGYTGWLSTYYVYDNVDRLRFVIPPKAVEQCIANNWQVSQVVKDELCYSNTYDQRNRLVNKKIPGAAEVYMVYDTRDRLIMTQDGNLRGLGKWQVVVYDDLNRPVKTGLLTDASTPFATHQLNAVSSSNYPSISANFELLTENYYDNYSWVSSSNTTLGSTIDNSYFLTTYFLHKPFALPFAASLNPNYSVEGMLTGTKTKVLGSTPDKFLYTVNFYDDKGRIIQTQSVNNSGGKDIATTQYDFNGKPVRSLLQHGIGATASQNYLLATRIEYDHADRVTAIKKTIISTIAGQTINYPERTIELNTYDELGQLKIKKLGNKPNNPAELETLTYDYNIRGWLLGLNRDYAKDINSSNYFGFDLGYDKANNGIINNQAYANPQYDGNISGTVWKSAGDGEKRRYDFKYDNANRLLAADFNQYTGGSFNKTANVDFSVIMGDGSLLPDGSIDYNKAYDANGNILQMQQRGLKINASSLIDNLMYTYLPNSNKLKNVRDDVNDATSKLSDFKTSTLHPQNTDKTNANTPALRDNITDYAYDDNGNLKRDYNKDIGNTSTDGILYNHLNLPYSVTVKNASNINGKGTIIYTYDAVGNKLQKITTEKNVSIVINGTTYTSDVNTITDYIREFVYESKSYSDQTVNTALGYSYKIQFLGHEEGRIRALYASSASPAPPTSFAFDYFVKDHLGNTRAVLTDQQQIDQYPAATMELAQATTEELLYSNVSTTRVSKPAGYPTDNTTSPNDKVALTNGNGSKIGPSIILRVMAGDKFNIKVSSWYKTYGASPSTPNNPINDLISGLINGVSGASGSGGHGITGTELQNSGVIPPGANSFLTNQSSNSNGSKPQAFLNWILLDEQFNLVSTSSGFEQVGENEEFKLHVKSDMPVSKNGYLYVYVSNSTPNIDVFFDNLQITHTRGQLLEETHYYPFGLTMTGISSKSAGRLENKRKFNKGSELQSNEFSDGSGLELYATSLRNLDPQLGRWWQIDSKPDYSQSVYSAMNNNPILFNDPLGDSSVHVDEKGNVLRNYNDGDNSVFVHTKGTTAEDVDKKYNSKDHSAEGTKIGEIGGKIDASTIFKNLLKANISYAKGIINPFTFKKLVRGHGDWDLKNNKNTIFGLAHSLDKGKAIQTQFIFSGKSYTAEDLGNFHFGATGKAVWAFNEDVLLRQAGAAQIAAGTSKPEWQPVGGSRGKAGRVLAAPYGDDPHDQEMIKEGFKYYDANN